MAAFCDVFARARVKCRVGLGLGLGLGWALGSGLVLRIVLGCRVDKSFLWAHLVPVQRHWRKLNWEAVMAQG